MKAIIALAAVLALAGCGTPQGAAVATAAKVVKQAVEDGVDETLDRSREFMCNDASYRAEMAARQRWGVSDESWDDYCARTSKPGR